MATIAIYLAQEPTKDENLVAAKHTENIVWHVCSMYKRLFSLLQIYSTACMNLNVFIAIRRPKEIDEKVLRHSHKMVFATSTTYY